MAKRRGIKGTSGRVIQPWHFPGSAVCHDNARCEDGRDPQRGDACLEQAEAALRCLREAGRSRKVAPLEHRCLNHSATTSGD